MQKWDWCRIQMDTCSLLIHAEAHSKAESAHFYLTLAQIITLAEWRLSKHTQSQWITWETSLQAGQNACFSANTTTDALIRQTSSRFRLSKSWAKNHSNSRWSHVLMWMEVENDAEFNFIRSVCLNQRENGLLDVIKCKTYAQASPPGDHGAAVGKPINHRTLHAWLCQPSGTLKVFSSWIFHLFVTFN